MRDAFVFLPWLISWVVHFVFFRDEWVVELSRLGRRRHRDEGPRFLQYEGFRSRRDAENTVEQLVAQVESGDLTP
jgi:hypothetical protein